MSALADGLRGLLPAWGHDPGEPLRCLGISENAIFLVGDGIERPPIVLRVHRAGYHSETEILSELAWIAALGAQTPVVVPRTVPTTYGSVLGYLRDSAMSRIVAAFEYLPGAEPDGDGDRIRWFAELGAIAAHLHGHSRRWARPPDFTRKRWDFGTIVGERAYWGDWRANPGIDAQGRAVLERLHVRLRNDCGALGDDKSRFGLVHGDMRAANLLLHDERLAVIDFDDCGFSWFGSDFAAAVSFVEHDPAVPALQAAWLDGYRRVSPFSLREEQALPILVMLRRLQLTAWTASHADTATARALGPAYAAGTVELAERYLTRGDVI